MTQIHVDGFAVIKEQKILNTQMLKRKTIEEKFSGQLSNIINNQSRKKNLKKMFTKSRMTNDRIRSQNEVLTCNLVFHTHLSPPGNIISSSSSSKTQLRKHFFFSCGDHQSLLTWVTPISRLQAY